MKRRRLLRSEKTLTSECLRHIGVLALESAGLEVLVQAARDRLKLNKPTRRVGLTGALTGLRDHLVTAYPAEAAEVSRVFDRAVTLVDQRNTAIHGVWSVAPGWDMKLFGPGPRPVATNLKPSWSGTTSKPVRGESVVKVARKIAVSRRDLKRLLKELRV